MADDDDRPLDVPENANFLYLYLLTLLMIDYEKYPFDFLRNASVLRLFFFLSCDPSQNLSSCGNFFYP